jgi:hypothetical protein
MLGTMNDLAPKKIPATVAMKAPSPKVKEYILDMLIPTNWANFWFCSTLLIARPSLVFLRKTQREKRSNGASIMRISS